jgi:drug/metabolite transporter (DMT)-like permease
VTTRLAVPRTAPALEGGSVSRRGSLAEVATSAAFVLVWSSGYLVGSIGARHGPPLALTFWRFLIAFTVLAAAALVTRAPWPAGPRAWLHLLVAGTLLQAVQLGGIYLGFAAGVPAGLSSLVLSATPLVVAAAAVPLFAERLSGRQWLGLGLGLLGVALSLGSKLSGAGHQLAGYAFTVIALAGFAAGTLYQKRFGARVDLRSGTAVQLLGATATTLPLAAVHGGLTMPLTAPALGSLAWLATVNSTGGFLLLFALLRRRTGGAATSLLYLVPPVTALLGVPLLGQPLTLGTVAGMAVSGIGVALVTLPRRRVV